jgi:ADP-glucose pyrophosphorylase
MNVRHMVEYHQEKRADITIAAYPVPVEEASRFGVLQVDEEWRITEFQEKAQGPQAPSQQAPPGLGLHGQLHLPHRGPL